MTPFAVFKVIRGPASVTFLHCDHPVVFRVVQGPMSVTFLHRDPRKVVQGLASVTFLLRDPPVVFRVVRGPASVTLANITKTTTGLPSITETQLRIAEHHQNLAERRRREVRHQKCTRRKCLRPDDPPRHCQSKAGQGRV